MLLPQSCGSRSNSAGSLVGTRQACCSAPAPAGAASAAAALACDAISARSIASFSGRMFAENSATRLLPLHARAATGTRQQRKSTAQHSSSCFNARRQGGSEMERHEQHQHKQQQLLLLQGEKKKEAVLRVDATQQPR